MANLRRRDEDKCPKRQENMKRERKAVKPLSAKQSRCKNSAPPLMKYNSDDGDIPPKILTEINSIG